MRPHPTVVWALYAWNISDNYLPFRSDPESFIRGFNEAAIQISVIELLKRIELTLKERINEYYITHFGNLWWHHLPEKVRRNAGNLRRWAITQLGNRRILKESDISWLSMGDALSVLNEFSPEDWQVCLKTENKRKKAFDKALRQIKIFRDYHIAHPKPQPITTRKLSHVCSVIRKLPSITAPNEWNGVLHLLDRIKILSPDDREAFFRLALSYSDPNPHWLKLWLSRSEVGNPAIHNNYKRISRKSLAWRYNIVNLCADLDPGGHVFFGRKR